jgi:HSP20 family protein
MDPLTTPRPTLRYVSPLSPFFGRDLERFITSASDLGGAYRPDLDVHEDAHSITVTVDLPGVAREEVQATFHEGVLTISGQRKAEAPGNGQETQAIHRERAFGRFERRVTLESPISSEQVKATHKDGVLTVTLPKVAEVRPRTIEIATA